MTGTSAGFESQKPPHELQRFMQQLATEMVAEYARIRSRAAQDPGTAGDEGEENWKDVFESWLPSNFPVVTKGQIIGIDGTLSPQVDVLILTPSCPKKMLGKKKYLASGVVAAFECKLTLKKAHIEKAAETCRKVQRIAEAVYRPPSIYTDLNSPIIYRLLAHSASWSKDTAIEQIDRLLQAEINKDDLPRRSMDVVCVSDGACWTPFHSVMPSTPPQDEAEFWHVLQERYGFGDDGAVVTQYLRWTPWVGEEVQPNPLYGLIAKLLRRIAWEFPDLRRLADYWNGTEIPGGGLGSVGAARNWPLSILSPEVLARVEQGDFDLRSNWGRYYW
jgi:hypothetical protein